VSPLITILGVLLLLEWTQLFGVGPAVTIPAAVKAAGLEIEDIGLFEFNEVYSGFNPSFLNTAQINAYFYVKIIVFCCSDNFYEGPPFLQVAVFLICLLLFLRFQAF
jgi:hypothetical protein